MAKVSEVRFQMTDETLRMQYDTTWLQEAVVQSLLVARLAHSRADTAADGNYPSSAFSLSRDSIFDNEVMKIINKPFTSL